MIVLGFDPGAWTGYAVVDLSPRLPMVLQSGKLRGDQMDGSELIDAATKGLNVALDLIAVEKVIGVYPRAGFSPPMATALANATRIEGRILEAASHRRIHSSTCSASEWRYAILGDARPSDALVKSALDRRVQSRGKMNAHSRDAVGTALFCGMRSKLQVVSKRSGAGA